MVGWLNCRGEDGGVHHHPMKGPSRRQRCAGRRRRRQGGRGGRRGGGDKAPQRIPDGGSPDVEHWSAHGKNVEGFIQRAMEMIAATATARGSDDSGGDDNNDNFVITMVVNLDLRTAGVRWYVARLNLTGGMAVSLFFQGGDGSSGGGGKARGEGEN